MEYDQLYIQGLGRYLPAVRTPCATVLAGYPEDDIARAVRTGMTHVAVERELFPRAMALRAAQEALERAQCQGSDLGLLAVSAIHRHGHKRLWSLASSLQAALQADQALPFNVQQGCNANLITLQLAASYLRSMEPRQRALIVASDRFDGSGFDRVTSDFGMLYGDAATALVLGREPSGLRILGIATEALASAEAMHRDDQERDETGEASIAEHDVRESKRRYLAEHGQAAIAHESKQALLRIKSKLLPGDAERELDHIVFPNLGEELLEANYYPVFESARQKSLWAFGRTVGHLGTADAVAGLYELTVVRSLSAGTRVLLIGAGAGFTFSGVLLECNSHVLG